ncbi:glycosyltransferase family 4 protein [Planktothrix agardhii]|jgi:glycosyltransferase involved in cell wall biosynthesis|uniref:glycosyltransferase family 4 protein n=1 Tax=Planktothrix agardhii TaxID=1160 RepID=UPI00241EC3B7|nr:glycosyltransferase family 4 protein [Planktothrix agardhii]
MLQDDFGINVAGHITGDFGLAEAVRANIRAIKAADIPLALNNLDLVNGQHPDTTYTDFSEDHPYPINLVHTNPNWVYEGIYNRRFNNFSLDYFKDRYNIGFWFWELPKFPSEWEFAFDFFDEIWTASGYVAESVSRRSHIPVVKIPLCIELDKPSLTRQELGLPENKLIFLFTFDFGSSFIRKNPLATIKAFQQAFGEFNEDVILVIKFSNAHHYPAQREQLLSIVKDWSSIHIIEGHLPKQKIHALLYNCDCYVSLHCAEGFGLGMAEAMFYGKPVIATAYSSNMDFMNVGNSFLVQYDLVTTTEDYGPYPKGSIWAEADVDHAASAMRYVFENYTQAKKIGDKAAEDIHLLLSPEAAGVKIQHRLEYIFRRIGVNSSGSSKANQIHQLQVEKDGYFSQAQAWKKTAKQIQYELKQAQSESSRIDAN